MHILIESYMHYPLILASSRREKGKTPFAPYCSFDDSAAATLLSTVMKIKPLRVIRRSRRFAYWNHPGGVQPGRLNRSPQASPIDRARRRSRTSAMISWK